MAATIQEIISGLETIRSRYEIVVNADGEIRARRNGFVCGLITALARTNGMTAYDDIEAAGKMGIKHGVLNTIQKAADKAPGMNVGIRSQLNKLAFNDETAELLESLV
jgi:hypothetical protein